MSKFVGFGDKYDLTKLKEYVRENKVLDKFALEEQKDLLAMARKLEEFMSNDGGGN